MGPAGMLARADTWQPALGMIRIVVTLVIDRSLYTQGRLTSATSRYMSSAG